MRDILKDLNKEQQAAVENVDGPVMVVAGAGSGKTRALTYRVAHLLNLGINPFGILALTFTNKAAREMKERILRLVGSTDARNVWMGTFHSIFARLLRIEAYRLGYPSNYTIYDTDDTKRLIRSIIKEQNLDDKVYTPSYVMYRISSAKTSLITARDYNENEEIMLQDKMAGKPMMGHIYKLYHSKCFRASAMDFDDLLLNTYILLRDYPDVLIKYQRKFEYILVDEFQDTNHVQYMILRKLAANNENICVVGDDAQSIYAFRGANIKNILHFQKDYPDVKVFKLEQNYRSTKTIVDAANGLIGYNKEQIFKKIWTDNEAGDLITIIRSATDNEEGNAVANAIFEQRMNRQLRNDAFAVLYRTNAQSRAIEEALRRLNIPYRVYGGTSFYNRREIKDMLAYFRLVVNNRDEEAFFRVINLPARGIGKTSVERMIVEADKRDKPVWDILEPHILKETGINAGTIRRIMDFKTMILSFSVQLKSKNAYELGKRVASSSGLLKALYDDKSPEGINRYENTEELINALSEFNDRSREPLPESAEGVEPPSFRTLDEFMQEVALLTDADTDDKEDTDRVSLMTVHSAKGLEFPYVFVVGLEENLFPSIQSLNTREELEEERRLFYVAITRTRQKLYLSYAESRYRWGNHTFCEPSRFIEEIDLRFIHTQGRGVRQRPLGSNSEQIKKTKDAMAEAIRKKRLKKLNEAEKSTREEVHFESSDVDKIRTGDEVEHPRFGKGKVLRLEGAGPSRKATVFFKTVGQKNLLLKFARLKLL